MRKFIGVALVALSSCADQPAPPMPVTGTPVRAPLDAPNVPSDLLPPGNPAGPVVVIGGERITLEGKLVGSVRAIDSVGRLQKVDELFETMKDRRVAWKAAHKSEIFAGVASLVVAPGTSGRAFASVYQTMAFAGFPNVHVAVGDRYYATSAQIPEPPCGTPKSPCPPQARHILHVQADEKLWRLRVPREGGPLDAIGEGPRSSIESFRTVVSELPSTARIGAITLHVAQDVSFSRLAPFLAEVVDLNGRARITGGVTVSVREMDIVQGG